MVWDVFDYFQERVCLGKFLHAWFRVRMRLQLLKISVDSIHILHKSEETRVPYLEAIPSLGLQIYSPRGQFQISLTEEFQIHYSRPEELMNTVDLCSSYCGADWHHFRTQVNRYSMISPVNKPSIHCVSGQNSSRIWVMFDKLHAHRCCQPESINKRLSSWIVRRALFDWIWMTPDNSIHSITKGCKLTTLSFHESLDFVTTMPVAYASPEALILITTPYILSLESELYQVALPVYFPWNGVSKPSSVR